MEKVKAGYGEVINQTIKEDIPMLETPWSESSRRSFKIRKTKAKTETKAVTEQDKKACEVRRRREAIEEDIALKKEFDL